MKIYILFGLVNWECADIISIHYSNEDAEEARAKDVKDEKDGEFHYKYDDYRIEEHEIN